MFARKVKSIFDKFIPLQAMFKKIVSYYKKHFYPCDKDLFKAYKKNMTFWEVDTIKQWMGELVYIVQGPKNTHKRHIDLLRKCRLNEPEESPQNTCEETIDATFDHFDLGPPKSLRKYDAREEKENLRNHSTSIPRRRSINSFTFFAFFPRKKNSWKVEVVRP